MNLNNIPVKGARALMLGITFKEIYPVKCEAFYYGDCPDTSEAKSRTRFGIRNTKAIDIYHELKEYGMDVDVYDPCLSR
jgi:UDP-N-acetyl-D-galactosamine dehydrogenase